MSAILPPNYTQTPNVIFELMPQMKEAELRITLTIIRETLGWHKHQVKLSITRLMKLTGLSRQGVLNGVTEGVKRGTISKDADGDSFVYQLVVNEVDPPSQRSRLPVVNEVDPPSQRSRLPVVNEVDREVVNEVDPYKETNIKKDLKKKEGESVDLSTTATAPPPMPTKSAEAETEQPSPTPIQAIPEPPISESPPARQPWPQRPVVNRSQSAAAEQVKAAKAYGLTPADFCLLTDTVLDGFGKKALADAGDDRALNDAKNAALLLVKMNERFRTAAGIEAIFTSWQENDYRGHTTPTTEQLTVHASQILAGKIKNETRGKRNYEIDQQPKSDDTAARNAAIYARRPDLKLYDQFQ